MGFFLGLVISWASFEIKLVSRVGANHFVLLGQRDGPQTPCFGPSDRPHEKTGEHYREVKKQKTLPHWSKKRPIMEDCLDVLSSDPSPSSTNSKMKQTSVVWAK
jgi:hypothetical protein